ncbi:MAG: hypothetical protein AB8G15_12410 [Saprospiraceae bacterium]
MLKLLLSLEIICQSGFFSTMLPNDIYVVTPIPMIAIERVCKIYD